MRQSKTQRGAALLVAALLISIMLSVRQPITAADQPALLPLWFAAAPTP